MSAFLIKLVIRLWLVLGFSAVTAYAVKDATYDDGLGFEYIAVGLLVILPASMLISEIRSKTSRPASRVRRQA